MQAQELLDRDEITRLVYRLGVVLDEGRFDEMPSIFTEDATVHTPGGLAKGRDALTAQAQRTHSPGERIQHVVGNVLIDLDGDRADVRANLVVTFATGNPPEGRLAPAPRLTLGEVYRFQAARTPQGWRLTHLRSTPIWATGSPS